MWAAKLFALCVLLACLSWEESNAAPALENPFADFVTKGLGLEKRSPGWDEIVGYSGIPDHLGDLSAHDMKKRQSWDEITRKDLHGRRLKKRSTFDNIMREYLPHYMKKRSDSFEVIGEDLVPHDDAKKRSSPMDEKLEAYLPHDMKKRSVALKKRSTFDDIVGEYLPHDMEKRSKLFELPPEDDIMGEYLPHDMKKRKSIWDHITSAGCSLAAEVTSQFTKDDYTAAYNRCQQK